LSAAIIKSINSTLRQEEADAGFRSDSIVITGSNHTPPDYVDIAHLINEYLLPNMKKTREAYLKSEMKISAYIDQVAKLHCLFEAIHPFSDGNGRTGRIFLNCMLISSGLPPVIIKGADNEREKYYAALEEFDESISRALMFKESNHRINKALEQSAGADKMVSLITSSLKYSLDTFICNTLENRGLLMSTTSKLSNTMDYTADSLRVMINRAQLIAKKTGKPV
jgi:Fic family protein